MTSDVATTDELSPGTVKFKIGFLAAALIELRDAVGQVDFDGKGLTELAVDLRDFTIAKGVLDEIEKLLTPQYDILRKVKIPEKMDEQGIETFRATGIGTVYLQDDLYTGIPADKKVEAYQWLRDNGHEDLIQETVNSSTLKAFLKEQMRNSGEVPPPDLIKAEPYTFAKLKKS